MDPKIKKIAIGSCAIALIAVISVGGSIAYLSSVTEQRVNNFTFSSKALDARLTEPDWDGVIDYVPDPDKPGGLLPVYDYDDDGSPVYGYDDGDPEKPITDLDELKDKEKHPNPTRPKKGENDEPYGDEQAQNMVPGQVAHKNPLITNTGKYDEWVAIKITFVYAEGSEKAGKPLSPADYLKVTAAIDIDDDDCVYKYSEYKALSDEQKANADKWVRAESGGTADSISQIFYYPQYLESGDETSPIFTTVTVKDGTVIGNDEINALIDIKGFAIWIEGYAVQREQYESGEDWIKSEAAEFANTPTEQEPKVVTKPGIFAGS